MARADGLRADRLLVARRVEDLLRIRLDGAEWWDVKEFVRENQADPGSCWFASEGASPLSESQIRHYMEKADEAILASVERNRKNLIRRHVAKRRNLHAKAITGGDYRTALACLQDEGKLLDLYPRHSKTAPAPDDPTVAPISLIVVEAAPPRPPRMILDATAAVPAPGPGG